MTSKDFYNVKIVNDIIYNEPTHTVAVFKDYLIYDDLSEFLKRFYSEQEAVQRLPKVFEFYEKYSKVFPNYVNLGENKYMYKNIERKQKVIDEKQKHLSKNKKKQHKEVNDVVDGESNEAGSMSWLKNSLRFFNTKFMDSIRNMDSFLKHSAILSKKKREKKNIVDMDMSELVSAFMNKDSQINDVSGVTGQIDITIQSTNHDEAVER